MPVLNHVTAQDPTVVHDPTTGLRSRHHMIFVTILALHDVYDITRSIFFHTILMKHDLIASYDLMISLHPMISHDPMTPYDLMIAHDPIIPHDPMILHDPMIPHDPMMPPYLNDIQIR